MNTIEFFIEVRDTTPIYLASKDSPPPAAVQDNISYWALSADAYGKFPPVLMHIYCRGRMPTEERRDELNAAIKDFVGQLLTGQDATHGGKS